MWSYLGDCLTDGFIEDRDSITAGEEHGFELLRKLNNDARKQQPQPWAREEISPSLSPMPGHGAPCTAS